MTKVKTITTAFNAGELSPKVYGRVDLQQYQNGCKKLLNAIVYPQGGCKKREGFQAIGALGIERNLNPLHVRIENFIFSSDETYVVIFSGDSNLTVYDCNTGKSVASFLTSYANDAVNQLSIYQSQDTMIICYPTVAPMQLVRDRTGSSTVWRFSKVILNNIPTYLFDAGTSVDWKSATMKFDGFGAYNNQTTPFTLSHKSANHTFKYNSIFADVPSSVTDSAGDEDPTPIINQIKATSIGNSYNISATFKNVVISVFNPQQGWHNVTVKRLAQFNLTAKDQSAGGSAVGVVKTPDWATITITSSGGSVAPTKEPVWSDKRGWPAIVTIHQGRLWFGGSNFRPQTLWASRSGQYFDFGVSDPDNLLANDALDITLGDSKSNSIMSLSSQKSLMVFTNGGVYTISGEDNLITPTTVFATKQSEFGSKHTPSVELDSTTLYLQSQGAQLNSISYSFSTDSFITNPQSLLSDHLLKNPRSLSVVQGADEYNSNFLFVCNSDGTLAMFNRLESQETSTWTPIETDGFISDVCGVFNAMWCVVQRFDGKGQPTFILERFVEGNEYIDSYIVHQESDGTHVDEITPPDINTRFTGRDLLAVADGYPISVKCDENNVIKLPFKANKIIYGLPYTLEIETLPYAAELKSGNTRFGRKRVQSAKFDMADSLGFNVQYAGRVYKVADRKMGFKLKEPPRPISEIKTVRLLGFNEDGNIKLTSTEAVPVNLRSLQLEVVVTG